MSIKIGNKNKVKNSIIGSNNSIEKKNNLLIEILITIITGVIIAGIVYFIGWN